MFNYFQNYQNQDERIWVPNAQAAESYLVGPGAFVRLWDANAPRFYERRTDASGRPAPMETFEYRRAEQPQQENPLAEQVKNLEARLSALESKGKKKEAKNDKSGANDTGI